MDSKNKITEDMVGVCIKCKTIYVFLSVNLYIKTYTLTSALIRIGLDVSFDQEIMEALQEGWEHRRIWGGRGAGPEVGEDRASS